MDPKPVEDFVAAGILLLLILFGVWLFCKVLSFIFNIIFSSDRKVIAIDTESVGAGDRGQINMLARVSIVNRYNCFYDKYVAPFLPVTDYRTFVSGIRPRDLVGAESPHNVRREVKDILEGCILVGHDVQPDLSALGLSHPAKYIRDTALYRPFRRVPHEKPSLKYLARNILGRTIQGGEHSSVEDAQTAMDLYLAVANDWERSLKM